MKPILTKSTQRGSRQRSQSKLGQAASINKDFLKNKRVQRDASTASLSDRADHKSTGYTAKSCGKITLAKKKKIQHPTPDPDGRDDNCDAYEHLLAAQKQLVQQAAILNGENDDVSE